VSKPAAGWLPVCHVSEVAEVGQYVVLPWGPDGGEIAVSRMGPVRFDGLVAWDNRCPHRGRKILPAACGRSDHVCAYHGRTAHAGNVRHHPLDVHCDFVWVSVAGGATGWQPGCGILPWSSGSPRTWSLHSELRLVMDCDWTVAVENALDAEHINSVHADSLAQLGLAPEALNRLPGGSSCEVFTSAKSAELDRLGRALDFGRSVSGDYLHLHLAPFSCFSSTRGYALNFQQYFPAKDGKTLFIHKLYGDLTAKPAARRAYLDKVAAMNKMVFEEDADICQGVPAGYGKLGPSDLRIQHFRSSL